MRARWTPISRKYPNHSAAATIARACSRRRAKGSDVESDNHANDYASTLRHNIQSHCPLVSGSHTTTPMSLGPRVPTQVTGFARCGTEVPSFAILRWRSQDQDRLILVKDSTPTRGQSYMQSNSGHDLKHCQVYCALHLHPSSSSTYFQKNVLFYWNYLGTWLMLLVSPTADEDLYLFG